MIVSGITDGLGNQMFQYAAARRLAALHKVELYLDLSSYTAIEDGRRFYRTYESKEGSLRSFQLNRFNITGRMIGPGDVLRFLFMLGGPSGASERPVTEDQSASGMFVYRSRSMLESLCQWLKNRNHLVRLSSRILEEKHFHVDPGVLSAPDNVYLKGHWESEKYFSDIRDVLLREFVLNTPLTGRNADYAKQIDSSESVSVHIRRGDNLRPFALKRWGLIPAAYYDKCMDFIAGKIANPQLFIFSNDIAWCRENISFRFPVTYVEGNNEDAGFVEMELMRRCRHAVIANSSFSWWGAWLSGRNDKIVCAPSRWFNEYAVDTKDLIPESWIRVSNV